MIDVVAALVFVNGRFLICQRPEGKNCAGQWEFAGGKIEPGETGAEALRREWMEELGLELCVGEALAETTHVYPNVSVHLTLYAAEIASGTPQLLEHSGMAWIAPDEIEKYSFCPADAKLVSQLQEKGVL